MSPARTSSSGLPEHPARNLKLEERLRRYKVKFDFLIDVNTTAFDIDRGLKNQVRFKPINEKTVARYEQAARLGDVFPAVMAYRPGRGVNPKLVSIGGNHRIVSHHRADRTLCVYELDRDTDAKLIALLGFKDNADHGDPATEDEALAHAFYLTENGSTIEDAAREVSAPLAKLKRMVTQAKANERANEAGLDPRIWESIRSAEARKRLLTLHTNEGFVAGATLTKDADLSSNEVDEMVTTMNQSRGGKKQADVARTFAEEIYADRIQAGAGGMTDAPRKGQTQRPRTKIGLAVGQINAVADDVTLIVGSYAPAERDKKAREIRLAGEKLIKLADAIVQSDQ